jgi:hypothetical protein
MATQNKLEQLMVNVGGTTEVVELTSQEVEEYENYVQEMQLVQAKQESEIESKNKAKESAIAKLKKLGLDLAEIESLIS